MKTAYLEWMQIIEPEGSCGKEKINTERLQWDSCESHDDKLEFYSSAEKIGVLTIVSVRDKVI